MRTMLAAALLITALSAAQGTQTFVGTVSDDMCPTANHAQMRMGPTDAECTVACVTAHSAEYVLYDGTRVFQLGGLRTPEEFAGRKVRVVGTLDDKKQTIQVSSIALAE
jgi:hypothetical protein